MKTEQLIRSFGLLPADRPLPTGRVRSDMQTRTVVGQWVMTSVFVGFLGLGGLIPLLVGVLGDLTPTGRAVCVGLGVFFLCAAAMVFWLIGRDSRWVEIDGDVLRAKNLYTGRITERRVDEINDVLTEVMMVRNLAARLYEKKYGRVRGFAVRFHDLPKGMKVVRPEMTNVGEFIAAVLGAMGRKGPLAPEVITLDGRPVVRRVTWAQRPG